MSTANLPGTTGLQPRWIGPFRIQQAVSANAYRLNLPASMQFHPVINISQLKKYHRSQESQFPDRPNNKPPPVQVYGNEDGEFEVEEILGHRFHRRKLQYLIKWKGYPSYDATWEPESHLRCAKPVLKKYKDAHPELQS